MIRLHQWTAQLPKAVSDDRGDVPGWVLITIMTAGIVAVIWGVAEDLLRDLLQEALSSVSPRG